jgi:hypothetical protein
MKNIKQEISIWVQLLTFVVLWGLILISTGTQFNIPIEALKKLPDVVTAYTVVYLIFSKWLWRKKIFQGWLVPFPDLQGTWKGTLKTTWINPKTGKVPKEIPLSLVIKQSFDSISCTMFTKESASYSNATLISENEESGSKKLSYNYTNKPDPTVRDKSAIHDGAAILTIISKPEFSLEGEYWTSRKSTGSIKLKFFSKMLDEKFTE